MTDAERIAAFLASKGATVVAPAAAYGVDKEADKANRLARQQREADASAEHRAERLAETVREAYHVGGRAAAIDALNIPERWRV